MKKMLLLLAVGGCTLALPAQVTTPGGQKPATQSAGITAPKGNARIKGAVVDSTTGRPVEFATVALLAGTDHKPIDGVVSDAKGEFALTRVAAGAYQVSVTFIGYETRIVPYVTVPDRGEMNLGRVFVRPDVTQLREITVTGEKDLVEEKVDRLVYNAEKDITNAGGTASDVLRKVPLLSVDLDGNVQLRGSANVRVLLNGKPSTLLATGVADALRQIPADMIKTVEVITSPSARYDAEGTAGIINIVTRKNNLQGGNGSVFTSVGNRSDNAGGNVNFRRRKFGVNAGAGANYFNNPGDASLDRANFFGNEVSYLVQQGTFRNEGGGGYGQLGFDYDLNEKNALNASFRVNRFQSGNTNDLQSAFTDGGGVLLRAFDRAINSRNRSETLDWNLGYTKNFRQAGRELSVLGQHNVNRPQNKSLTAQTGLVNAPGTWEQNRNDGRNAESTLQTDYVHPFGNKTTLEAGAKAILRRVSSDYQFSVYDDEQAVYVADPAQSNTFHYDQDVLAGYTTYAFNWKKYGLKLGGRYEQTSIRADFASSDTSFTQAYGNFMPGATLSRELTKSQKMRFGYTRRIQRPQIFYLNPYVNNTDTLNLYYGNPTLDPEVAHSFELGYSAYVQRNSVNISLYWRQTDNAIERVRTVDTLGVSRTTFRNIAANRTLGVGMYGSAQPTTHWRLSGNVNVYQTALRSPVLNTSSRNVVYNVNVNTSYTFPRGFSAQAYGFFNSPWVQLQGRIGGFYTYNVAVKKELFKKKGSLTLGLDNPFNRSIRTRSFFETAETETTPGFTSSDVRNLYRRGVRLGFNCQFGKMDFDAKPRRKKSITNDDAKGSDGKGW